MSDTIQIGHGGGGLLSAELVREEILSRFGNDFLNALPDAALLDDIGGGPIVFSTDSFVVQPLEFPGGNIGDLAVYGTVNDLAVCGGIPLYLSLGLIIEEGLPFRVLRTVLDSVKNAAADCGVKIVTGDTKVVGKGQCDGLYLNTAGIGRKITEFHLGADRISAGDKILVSGGLAEHGTAVMAVRENIRFTVAVRSDTGPVHRLVRSIGDAAGSVKFMRDPTRGGAAAVLNEICQNRAFGIILDEESLPLSGPVRAVNELLGLDPLQIASEGRVIAICAQDAVMTVLERWRALPEGRDAAVIGEVSAEYPGRLCLKTVIGATRLVTMPQGELLPRIC